METAENKLITRVGAGTPSGKTLRKYWLPVGLSSEIASDAPRLVRWLGEDLLLFRDEFGRVGLTQPNCPHRGIGWCTSMWLKDWSRRRSCASMCRILFMSVNLRSRISRELRKAFTAEARSTLRKAFFSIALTFAVCGDRTDAGEARPAWRQDWEKAVRAAKTEGQVTVYVHSAYSPVLISGAFEKAFPGIKLNIVSGVENDLERRFSAERRAGKYLADVFMVGVLRSYDVMQTKFLEPIKPLLLLPEVINESKWWQGKHHYSDPDRKYLFRYVASAQYGQISCNTQLVRPKEFTSFWDFLSPKWKGNILSRDIRLPGTGGSAIRLFYYHLEMGPEFVRKLFAETDITLARDRRQGLDWLAAGKFSICFWCDGVDKANVQGLPVDTFGRMMEGAGLSVGQAILTYVNQAPHPNAAKVFINWFLSRDGQLNFQKALGKADEGSPDSLRIDIAKDDVDPKSRRLDGVKYLDTDQWLAMKPVLKVVEDALVQAGKK